MLGILLGSVLVAAVFDRAESAVEDAFAVEHRGFREHYDECITELQRAVETAPTCAVGPHKPWSRLGQRGRLDEG